MKRLLLVAAAALVLAAPAALAALTPDRKFADTGSVAKKGRQVQVTVLLECDRAQNARLRVTVTQDGGAVAEKRRKARCSTQTSNVPIKAKARGRRRFTPGQATACGLAVTRDSAIQWCKDVTLVSG